jgi:hypothetical protein
MNGKGDDTGKRTNFNNFSLNIDKIDWSTTIETTKEIPPEDYQEALRQPFFFEDYPHLTGVWRTDKYSWSSVCEYTGLPNMENYNETSK